MRARKLGRCWGAYLLVVLVTTQLQLIGAAPVGACAANAAYRDPSTPTDASTYIPVVALPLPAGVTVPAPRLPIVLRNSSELVQDTVQTPLAPGDDTARSGCPQDAVDLRMWHDPQTWPGSTLPKAGDDVVIPPGGVLLSSCSVADDDAFKSIKIPEGSNLVIADANISLTVGAINIVGGGLFIGSSTCRVRSRVTLTLVGVRPGTTDGERRLAVTAPPANNKGIVVSGNGIMDIHGVQYSPTWTRLAARASPGDTWIFVQDIVNWEVGQTIVITTTALRESRDYSESEERVLRALYSVVVDSAGNTITALQLDAPLIHGHYASSAYQAEVALLSRRVVVQGSPSDSAPTDVQPVSCPAPGFSSVPCGNTSLTGYGGHIMVMGTGATGRLSGVLLLRMGQTNNMGRYAMHFHLVGEGGSRSYIQDCAIWRSYFRCVSVHGTNGTRLSRNVAHDVIGHCYYLEDGVEERNILEYNLASLIHVIGTPPTTSDSSGQYLPTYSQSDTLLLPADLTAAGFYVTNAYNKFIGNAASGGWTGFSFPNLPEPLGASRIGNPNFVPHARPTLVFHGNTAHSSGYWWLSSACIYVGGWLAYTSSDPAALLTYNPGRSNARDGLIQFNNTRVFGCNVGILNWGWQPEFRGLEAHDVTRAATIFGASYITDMLVTCRTDNSAPVVATGSQWLDSTFANWDMTAFQWYDTGQQHIVTNVTFRNCSAKDPQVPWRTVKTWELLTHSDQYLPGNMQITRNIRYEGVDGSTPWRIRPSVNATSATVSHRLQNWLDADGSASSRGVPTLLGSARAGNWWVLDTGNACTPFPDWTLVGCDVLPGRIVGSVTVQYDSSVQQGIGSIVCFNGGTADSAVSCPNIGTAYHVGGQGGIARGMRFTPNTLLTGPLNGFGWVIVFDQGSPRKLRFVSPQMRPADILMVVIPYPAGTTFNISQRVDYIDGSPCANWCSPDWCHCEWYFTPVASPDLVRNGPGDTYFFSGNATNAGYLYVRVTPQYSWAVATGPGGTWNIPSTANGGGSFVREGLEIPPMNWGSTLQVLADNCPPSAVEGLSAPSLFCAIDAASLAEPDPPCPDGFAASYDSCEARQASSTSAATPSPTSSTSTMPTSSAVNTGTSASSSFHSSATRSSSRPPSMSRTPTRTCTGTRSTSRTATFTRTSSRSHTSTGSNSRSNSSTRSAQRSKTTTATSTGSHKLK